MYEYICIHTHTKRGEGTIQSPKKKKILLFATIECVPQFVVFRGIYADLTSLEKDKCF